MTDNEELMLHDFMKWCLGNIGIADRGGVLWYWYDLKTNTSMTFEQIFNKFEKETKK